MAFEIASNADSGSLQENVSKRFIKKIVMRTKEFVERNSMIEDLMNDGRMVPVYSAFLAITMGLIIHTAAYDYFYKSEINFGQRLVLVEFSQLLSFLVTWIPLYFSNYLVYYGLKYWATGRKSLTLKSHVIISWDYFWFGLTILFYPGWLYMVTWGISKQNLSISLSIALHAEITRMLMKMHAFIRSNVPKILSYKPHSENDTLHPNISQFTYFLWAPTLVYRDSYPRTRTIRWNYVATKGCEFVLCLFLMSTITERYFINNFKDYGLKSYSWSDILATTIGNAGGGFIMIVGAMYCTLHVCQNIFAEICRFGDRLFYEDWWNSTGYERYYRTWNVIVHDWLYTYVYKDFYEIITPKKKLVAKYAVFFISAVFHEYVLGFSFKFFMPIVFIQFFTLGTIMTYINVKPAILGHAFMLYSLGLGNSIHGTFFALEYYARLNCPIKDSTVYDYFTPRLFSCAPY